MSDEHEWTAEDWAKTKWMVGVLLSKRKYDEARELLTMVFKITPIHGSIHQQALGALFILDLLHPGDTS